MVFTEKSREKIVALLAEDGTLSAAALAAKIGISAKAIEKHLANLKASGIMSMSLVDTSEVCCVRPIGWSTNPKRICLRFREIGFAPTTTPKRSFSSAMRGIGGISPVRRGHDGIRPFVRSN